MKPIDTLNSRLILPTLFLMISFPILNAVLFTPSLPNITHFFGISKQDVQTMMTCFLFGYALSQLIYAPFSNVFGRKPTLYFGIGIQIISSLLCVAAGWFKIFTLLVAARFFLAVGAGVGLNMTFTLVHDYYSQATAANKLSYIMLGLAITPGVSMAIGGLLNNYFGWQSCFYACGFYGVLLFAFSTGLPETLPENQKQSLRLNKLLQKYRLELNNTRLVTSGLLMGCANAFVYVFASTAPFIAISLSGMTSAQYGLTNLLPSSGLIFGLLCSAGFTHRNYKLVQIVFQGMIMIAAGVLFLTLNLAFTFPPLFSLFIPVTFVYFGIGLILPNASSNGIRQVQDRAFSIAIMNFINIGISTGTIFLVGFYAIHHYTLALLYCVIFIGMIFIFKTIWSLERLYRLPSS